MMSHVREVVVEMLKFKFGYIFINNQQNFCMCAYWKRYYSLSMSNPLTFQVNVWKHMEKRKYTIIV